MQQAAGIAGRDDLRLRGSEVSHFPVQEILSHLRLDQVVNARAAATPSALRQFHECQSRDGPQQLSGLRGDLLPVTQVASLMIGHSDRLRVGDLRSADADVRQPFMNILHLPVPKQRPRGVAGIFLEQLMVVLEMRPASGGVGDDGIKLLLLLVWIVDKNQPNLQLSRDLISEKALTLFYDIKLKLEDTSSDKFVVSRGWFNQFKNRTR